MEQNKEMLDRFRTMLEAVDEGLAAARNRRLGRATPPAPTAPPVPPGEIDETSGRPRFKAVRIRPSTGGDTSSS